MMKGIIALCVIAAASLGVYRFFQSSNVSSGTAVQNKQIAISRTPQKIALTKGPIREMNSSLFVPYWNASVDLSSALSYDTFIYFGIGVNEDGSIKKDQGWEALDSFAQSTIGKRRLLTIRMLDSDINHKILENTVLQDNLIREVTPILVENGFDGVVLDLEMSALPLSDISNNISLFIQRLYKEFAKEQKYFAVTIYGDVYYRSRPYDVKTIAESVDEIMIMVYDFHKSRGEPGPNFPFSDRAKYGYDFQAMLEDFKNQVPAEKLSVIMGMYGYDWALGPQGKPLKAARALPLTDIRELTEPNCDLTSCQIIKNKETKETKVTYVDEENYRHELWFEDEDSVEIKKGYLQEQGIGKVGYWVYGYW